MNVTLLRKKRTQKALRNLATFIYDHPGLILLVFCLLTVFFGVFASRLKQKTTLQDLLPKDNPVVRDFEETVADFNMIDRVVMVIQFEPENLGMAQFFADIFVDQVREDAAFSEYLLWLNANVFDQIEQTDYYQYLRYLTRFVPQESVEEYARRLSTPAIQAKIQQNYNDLKLGLASKTLIEKDPLSLLDLAATYRDEITGNYHLDLSEGYLVSQDHTMLLVLGRPTISPEHVDYSLALTDYLERQIEKAKQSFQEEEEVNPETLFQVGLTGPHPITAHEDRVIKGDVSRMFISSFVLVVLLFILAYGRPLALFYVGVPLLAAEVWTLGIGYFLFGRLNLLTATFSAVIVGLGIDFAIHIFSRYVDERVQGIEPLESMQIALSQTGLGTLVAGGTTALAFVAMGINHFRGLFEFASIATIAILLCMLQMFVLLPCLLFIRERLRRKPTPPFVRAQRGFKLESLLGFCLLHKKAVLVFLGLATLILGYEALHLRFNADLRSVRARSNPALALQNQVTSKVGGSLRSLTLIMRASSEEELYRIHQAVAPTLRRLKEEGKLVRYDTVLSFLQDPQHQQRNLDTLEAHGIEAESVRSAIMNALQTEGFRINEDNLQYIRYLTEGLEENHPITLRQLMDDIGESLLENLICAKGDSIKVLNHVYPARGLWERDATQRLTDEILNSVEPEHRDQLFFTGIQTLTNELKRLVRQSFRISCMMAVAMVILILVIHFRKISLVALTLAPLMVGVIWMLGTMQLLGMDINILNFVATPLIIGIGIDDGVHIVEKYLHRGEKNLAQVLASCAKAVTLTSLTTITGLSSLFLAEYSGFQSLGLSAILGVFYTWLASVILSPILLEIFGIQFVRQAIDN